MGLWAKAEVTLIISLIHIHKLGKLMTAHMLLLSPVLTQERLSWIEETLKYPLPGITGYKVRKYSG